MKKNTAIIKNYSDVHDSITQLIKMARHTIVRNINAFMTASYWEIGKRIFESEQLGQERADYGTSLIISLSSQLLPPKGGSM